MYDNLVNSIDVPKVLGRHFNECVSAAVEALLGSTVEAFGATDLPLPCVPIIQFQVAVDAVLRVLDISRKILPSAPEKMSAGGRLLAETTCLSTYHEALSTVRETALLARPGVQEALDSIRTDFKMTVESFTASLKADNECLEQYLEKTEGLDGEVDTWSFTKYAWVLEEAPPAELRGYAERVYSMADIYLPKVSVLESVQKSCHWDEDIKASLKKNVIDDKEKREKQLRQAMRRLALSWLANITMFPQKRSG